MEVKNLRNIISKNIITLRKNNNLTQSELAKSIDYSDKAVSRWENGEVIPDIETLQKISNVFQVPLSSMLEDQGAIIAKKAKTRQEILSQIFVFCEIWTIICVAYIYLNYFKGINAWQLFLWGIPATTLILFIINSAKNHQITSFVCGTILIWSSIVCIYLHLIPEHPWYIFFIGIPVQGMLILKYIFHFKQNKLILLNRKKKS
ncbi:MAG: helix-turn-helix transcriptional regulator [Clostridia bacterium]|nr:helix-turn-helix transcriptional regulator [Clostridia bacterium]